MKSLHQVIAAAVPGDAVTEQAREWRSVLRGWGLHSEIIAEHVHPGLASEMHSRTSDGASLMKEGPLLIRYSIWSEVVEAALSCRGPLGIIYHNITPGHLLRSSNAPLAEMCDRGRAELSSMRSRFKVVVADSDFNATELEAFGFPRATTIPLLLDLPETLPVRTANQPPLILSVGRVAPNKRLEYVIGCFALFQQKYSPESSLALVGPDRGFEAYRLSLERLIIRLGVRHVAITGWVERAEVVEWYRRADAYVCLSAHEGFCAPVVEALAFSVPVVANDSSALRQTVGGAGLIVDEGDLPLTCEALHEVTSSPRTREGLHALAVCRLEEFGKPAVIERIRQAIAPLLEQR